MQPSESSTDVACRRARGGHKETQLVDGNETTALAKSENCECGGKREHPQEKAWMLDDAAQWELLFQGEEAFGDQLNLYV